MKKEENGLRLTKEDLKGLKRGGAPFQDEDLWSFLKEDSRPIFLYGTGNGGDKIVDVLDRFNIPLSGVFASPGFERDRTFRGFKVENYDSVRERYGDDITVLLAFGTDRKTVWDFIKELDRRHLLLIPDVPLYGGELFTAEYARKNEKPIRRARELFDDPVSRALYDAVLDFRLTGCAECLATVEEPEKSYRVAFGEDIFRICDLGAYKGDSALMFGRAFPRLSEVIAFEADGRSFKKLSETAASAKYPPITPVNCALSDECGETVFVSSASRGSGVSGKNRRSKTVTVQKRTLDSFHLQNIDLIKFDVEGDETASLKGSVDTILRCRPSLAVSLYHRTEDIFAIPLLVKDLLDENGIEAKFSLRRPPCIPMWDVTLFVKI